MPLIGKLLVPFSSKARGIKELDTPEQLSAVEHAEKVRQQLGEKYQVDPFLFGSLRTGLNAPGDFDYDYGVGFDDPQKFQEFVSRLDADEDLRPSSFNRPGQDLYTYKTEMEGTPVDFNVMFGEGAKIRQEGVDRVAKKMEQDQERRLQLVKQKAAVKDILPKVPIIGRDLAYDFKKHLDEEIGSPRIARGKLPDFVPLDKAASVLWKLAAELSEKQLRRLSRSDVFGHRTTNLEGLLQSGKLMSAADAAKAGLIKDVEMAGSNRGKRVEVDAGPKQLRSEIFMTKGLLPPGTYGNYGVLFEKKKADPSRYLTRIPEEHTTKGKWYPKLNFVVPDEEYATWQEKYPDAAILRESQVPDTKRLPERTEWTDLVNRVLRVPKLVQDKEWVDVKAASARLPTIFEAYAVA